MPKLINYRNFPFWLIYLPLVPIYLLMAIKNRSFFFITNLNPSFFLSGFIGEKKAEIFQQVSHEALPKWIFLDKNKQNIEEYFLNNGFHFPFVLKPNEGERGRGVRVVYSLVEAKNHLSNFKDDFIVQEFINGEVEAGIFVAKKTKGEGFDILSLNLKYFPFVIGNGFNTISELINADEHLYERRKYFLSNSNLNFNNVLSKGEKLVISYIGNHSKGAVFKDYTHKITPELEQKMDEIAQSTKGFNYGRFDIKAESFEKLFLGIDLKIIELNGVSSDPTVIYDTSMSYLNALKIIKKHWIRMNDLSQIQLKRSIKPEKLLKVIKAFWKELIS